MTLLSISEYSWKQVYNLQDLIQNENVRPPCLKNKIFKMVTADHETKPRPSGLRTCAPGWPFVAP